MAPPPSLTACPNVLGIACPFLDIKPIGAFLAGNKSVDPFPRIGARHASRDRRPVIIARDDPEPAPAEFFGQSLSGARVLFILRQFVRIIDRQRKAGLTRSTGESLNPGPAPSGWVEIF